MPPRPFVVPVARLRREPGARRREVRRGPLREAFVTGSKVPAGDEVTVEVVLESVHGGILATGTVTATWVGECRRCLEPSSGRVEAGVRELFEEDGNAEESYPLSSDLLDLEPMVRDAVVLGLPLAPVCSQDCRGLCATCGTNLNEGRCSCGPAGTDPRWEALDVLREGGSRQA